MNKNIKNYHLEGLKLSFEVMEKRMIQLINETDEYILDMINDSYDVWLTNYNFHKEELKNV